MQQEHDVLQIHRDKTWHRVIRERWQKIKEDHLTSHLKSKDFNVQQQVRSLTLIVNLTSGLEVKPNCPLYPQKYCKGQSTEILMQARSLHYCNEPASESQASQQARSSHTTKSPAMNQVGGLCLLIFPAAKITGKITSFQVGLRMETSSSSARVRTILAEKWSQKQQQNFK